MTLKTYQEGSLRQQVLDFIHENPWSSERDVVEHLGRAWMRDGKLVYYDMAINQTLHTLQAHGWLEKMSLRKSKTERRRVNKYAVTSAGIMELGERKPTKTEKKQSMKKEAKSKSTVAAKSDFVIQGYKAADSETKKLILKEVEACNAPGAGVCLKDSAFDFGNKTTLTTSFKDGDRDLPIAVGRYLVKESQMGKCLVVSSDHDVEVTKTGAGTTVLTFLKKGGSQELEKKTELTSLSSEFVLDMHKRVCSVWQTKIEKEFPTLFVKEERVYRGDRFLESNGDEYIVAVVDAKDGKYSLCLVSLVDGNRWTEPIWLEYKNDSRSYVTRQQIEEKIPAFKDFKRKK